MESAPPPSPEPGPLLRTLVPAPDEIEPLSMRRIAAEAGELPWTGPELEMAMRLAYAVGDASVLKQFACSAGAVQLGVEALRGGASLIADVRMVLVGIDRRRAQQLGVAIQTRIDDPEVARLARERGITRSAQAILSQMAALNGAVVVVGNAPTALLALLDTIDAGLTRPALVLGFPVGYVAAAESKAELEKRDVPFITMRGARGGTPMAVSAANTLLRMATREGTSPPPPAPPSRTGEGRLPPSPAHEEVGAGPERACESKDMCAAQRGAGGRGTLASEAEGRGTPGGRIQVVGVGDDGLSGLSDRARNIVASAQTLYGGTRHLAMLSESPARRVNLSTGYADALDELVSGRCGDGAVVLASGDPLLFGIGSTLARHFGTATRDWLEIVPHPSSLQVALSRLGEPSENLTVLTALGRPLRPVVAAAMTVQRFAVLLDPQHDAPTVARALLAAGMEDAHAVVCERLEGADERIVRGTLSSVAAATFDPLSLLLVFRAVEEVAGRRRAAIPEDEFAHRAGQITKAEVRALAIAALQLRPDHVLWDIGAGSGSVGIEAALMLPRGEVYAVDSNVEQIGHIRTNAIRFRTPQVEPVYGTAPEVLDDLPMPDAVFIGGGGRWLGAILDATMARLRPGGRLVLTLATLERLGPTLETLKPWGPELRQIAISHGVPLADGTRLKPANPILLVAATKPTEPPAGLEPS